jgi:hypothetical protein
MKKEETTHKIVLEFQIQNVFQFYFLAHSIEELIKQNKDIPADLLRKFLILFDSYNRFQDIEKNLNEIIENCYNYLKNCGYDFSRRKVILSSHDINITHETENRIVAAYVAPRRQKVNLSLHDLLKNCYNKILNLDPVESLRIDKKGMMEFIYGNIKSYNFELGKKSLTQYKEYVITGIIASSIGLINTEFPSETIKPSQQYNKVLYLEVRNILRKKLPYAPLNY